MGFYFIVHFLMGMAAGASGWTFRCAGEDRLGVPAWVLGPWGLASAVVAVFSPLAAIVTTIATYSFGWALATVAELMLGAFFVGFTKLKTRFFFAAAAMPINIIILGALWGFWRL